MLIKLFPIFFLKSSLRIPKPVLSHNRKNDEKQEIRDSDRAKIAQLMPLDLWLYEYATRLFKARWNHVVNGTFIEPKIAPFPEVTCSSTRYLFGCKNGEFAPFISPATPKLYLKNFKRFFNATSLQFP